MANYYCKTENGPFPPKFKHNDINNAVIEAKRLSTEHKTDVEILKIVGKVSWKDIPVTTRKQVIEMENGYTIDDDLPF